MAYIISEIFSYHYSDSDGSDKFLSVLSVGAAFEVAVGDGRYSYNYDTVMSF